MTMFEPGIVTQRRRPDSSQEVNIKQDIDASGIKVILCKDKYFLEK